MIIVPGKEYSQCDVSGTNVTLRREPQHAGTHNAAIHDGSIPPLMQSLTRKRDSSLKMESHIGKQVGFKSEAGKTRPQRATLTLTHLNLGSLLIAHDQNEAAAQIRADLLHPLQIDQGRPPGAKEPS
jgi:hypothetical protein